MKASKKQKKSEGFDLDPELAKQVRILAELTGVPLGLTLNAAVEQGVIAIEKTLRAEAK